MLLNVHTGRLLPICPARHFPLMASPHAHPFAGDDEAARRVAQTAEGVASLFAELPRQQEVDAWFDAFQARLCAVPVGMLRAEQCSMVNIHQVLQNLQSLKLACPSPSHLFSAEQAERSWLCSKDEGEHSSQRTLAGGARGGGMRLGGGAAAAAGRWRRRRRVTAIRCRFVYCHR